MILELIVYVAIVVTIWYLLPKKIKEDVKVLIKKIIKGKKKYDEEQRQQHYRDYETSRYDRYYDEQERPRRYEPPVNRDRYYNDERYYDEQQIRKQPVEPPIQKELPPKTEHIDIDERKTLKQNNKFCPNCGYDLRG